MPLGEVNNNTIAHSNTFSKHSSYPTCLGNAKNVLPPRACPAIGPVKCEHVKRLALTSDGRSNGSLHYDHPKGIKVLTHQKRSLLLECIKWKSESEFKQDIIITR